MVSAFTPNKAIEQPAFNDYIDSWDVPVNADWGFIDEALGGVTTINANGLSGNQVLTTTQYRPLKIRITGTPAAAVVFRVPSGVGGIWLARNDTAGGFTISFDSAAGGGSVAIPAAQNTLISCDGTSLGMFAAINTPGSAAGSNTQIQFNNAGVLGGSANLTWDGTTLTSTGIATTGNTVLGNAVGDTLTINGTTVVAANGLAINTNQLFLNSAGTKVAIGTITPGTSTFTVAGAIESTSGGFVFPDASVQTSAATSPTGSVVAYVGATPPTGWILAFGTIGGVLSSATNRASADTLALFTLLWNSMADGQAPVSGGRGASAAADFAASKTIAVVDLRGRAIFGVGNMGGVDAGRLTAGVSSIAATTLGAAGGDQNPLAHTHTITDPGHLHQMLTRQDVATTGGSGAYAAASDNLGQTTQTGMTGITATNGSAAFTGGSGNVPPGMVLNYIIKL